MKYVESPVYILSVGIFFFPLFFFPFSKPAGAAAHTFRDTHTCTPSGLSKGNKITVKRKENKFRRSDRTFIKLCVSGGYIAPGQ